MALLQAVRQGNIRGIKLVTEGFNVDQHETGTTALIEACKFCDKKVSMEMVRLLLQKRARISTTDKFGRNALHWACSRGQKEIVDLFLRSKQCPNLSSRDLNGCTVLFHAVSSADCSFIKFICKVYQRHGGGVETRNRQGMSAVDLALKLGHRSCAALVNRVTGLDQHIHTAGEDELNCCTKRASTASSDELEGFTAGSKNIRRFDLQAERDNALVESGHFGQRIHMGTSGRRYMSTSVENLSLSRESRLPKLTVGNLTTRMTSNRQRSKTVPRGTSDLKAERSLIDKRNFPQNGFLRRKEHHEHFPNTYKDLLVDFNVIYSVENSPSYRRGFVRTKDREKAKIVTFSESTMDDLNAVERREDAKQEDKTGKAKASRKMSKVHDAKNIATLSKKERRKSRKSRDEG